MRLTARTLSVLVLVGTVIPAYAADVNSIAADLASTDGHTVESALKQITAMGPDAAPAAPAIIQLLKDKKHYAESDYGLDNVIYPQAFQALKSTGAKSDEALAVAMDYYQNDTSNPGVAPVALDIIAGYGDKAAPIVPSLASALDSNNTRFGEKRHIMAVLGQIGPAAVRAMPALLRAATAGTSADRGEAFAALEKIAPHDHRVLTGFAELVALKPTNSGDTENAKAFAAYVDGYGNFSPDDLATLGNYLTDVTDRDEATPNHDGHIVSFDPAYLPVAKIFLNYPDQAELAMPSLAARILQLDLHSKEFPATLELAGDFGAHAGSLAEPIYARATAYDHVTAGYLQPLAANMLEKIGTPDALEKAKALSPKH